MPQSDAIRDDDGVATAPPLVDYSGPLGEGFLGCGEGFTKGENHRTYYKDVDSAHPRPGLGSQT